MTSAADLFENPFAAPTPQVKRDQYGRRLLPDPETGEVRPWAAITTIAAELVDDFGIRIHNNRRLVHGMGQRPDLYARAAATPLDDSKSLDDIAEQALIVGKANEGANLGIALHSFTEQADLGNSVEVPEQWAADVALYRKAMKMAGLAVFEDWVERWVLVPEIGAIGILDRVLNAMDWQLPRVGDFKSGRNAIKYGKNEIPLQLACYAHAAWSWDPATDTFTEMPKVDQDVALVMHLPPGDDVCRLVEVDIAAGWEAVQVAMSKREWRKRKNLMTVFFEIAAGDAETGNGSGSAVTASTSPAPTASGDSAVAPAASPEATADAVDLLKRELDATEAFSPKRLAWLQGRVDVIKAHSPDARALLAEFWSRTEVPTFPAGGPRDDDELTLIAQACDEVEGRFEISFPEENDPAAKPIPKPKPKNSKRKTRATT